MTASETASRPASRGRGAKLIVGILAVIAAGIGLAWLSAAPLRGETTPTGVRIRTVTAGSGPYIQPMDGVMVDYEGRLADGTVFDSSATHGGPQPMIAGQVIPGFAEALGKMQKGGSYKIHIPGAQAYGANPPPGSPFGPNADLNFDVKIVNVVPNAALMAGVQGGQPGAEAPQGQPGAEAPAQPQDAPQQP